MKENQMALPETQIQKVVGSSPAEMMAAAIQNGSSLENLEKLLELQERWDKNEAKKAYHRAMAAFKANPPSIEKDKKVAYGNTKYNHASLANVATKINLELSRHGLSASWTVSQNGTVSVTCKITHEQGHSEETTMTAPADTSGSKNAIQAIGSTISYLERYSLLALCGLATHEMDDDGKTGATELIGETEMNALLDNLAVANIPIDKFLGYMKLDKLENMPKSELKKAMTAIEQKKAQKK